MTDQTPEIVRQVRTGGLGSIINRPVNLQLQYSGLFHAYQVVSITSTVFYRPGEWLSAEVVNECCQQKGWSVTMVHDDFLKKPTHVSRQLAKVCHPERHPMTKELFQVRDTAGKITGPSFDSKRDAKQHRNQLQSGKVDTDNPRKFFVTMGKDHHLKQDIGKW